MTIDQPTLSTFKQVLTQLCIEEKGLEEINAAQMTEVINKVAKTYVIQKNKGPQFEKFLEEQGNIVLARELAASRTEVDESAP